MSTLIQRSFSGGELTPALWARTDQVKYQTGLRTLRNMFVMKHGGAQSRPGTNYVGTVRDSTNVLRDIPFVFNNAQAYVLEFGNNTLRFKNNGAYVTFSAPSAWSSVTSYNAGDLVSFGGNNYSSIAGSFNNTPPNAAYWVLQGADLIYTIWSPYLSTELAAVDYVQSADVVTFAHLNYNPYELKRISATDWQFVPGVYQPAIAAPGNLKVVGTAGTVAYSYSITSVVYNTGEESLAFKYLKPSQLTAPATNNHTVYWPVVSGADAFNIYVSTGADGVTGLLAQTFGTPVGFMFTCSPAALWTAGAVYKDNGALGNSFTAVNSAASPGLQLMTTGPVAPLGTGTLTLFSGSGDATITFTARVVLASYINTGIAPDLTTTPPINNYDFGAVSPNAYPSVVAYIQQRLVFSNTNLDPTATWLSKSANYHNFTKTVPSKSDNSIRFRLAGQQVHPAKHIIDLGSPLIFTEAGEWTLDGDSSGILTPTSINPKQHSYEGSSNLKPLIVGGDALFVQALGSIVRNLAFNFQRGKFDGDDLSIFASHMFEGFTVVDWAYQKIPLSIVWAVRSDGVLLSLTYIREHQIVAWAKHDFDGTVENVCTIPEGSETSVYLIIKRTVNGVVVRYSERMTTRAVSNVADFIGMDCANTYDGRNTSVNTMTLSGGTTWSELETLTLTASGGSQFVALDATYGNQILLTGSDGSIVQFTIGTYTSATVVTGHVDRIVPASLRTTATLVWSKAVYHFSGLGYLEGKKVSVSADGYVVGSPNNASYTAYTVTAGALVLDKPYSVVHIGLPITSDLETLDIDTPTSGDSISNKYKLIGEVTVHLKDSGTFWVGGSAPTDSTIPLQNLTETKIREYENYDNPTALQTGKVTLNILPSWDQNGHVFIRNVDPLPLTVTGIAPDGLFPFKGGG